MCLLIAAEFDAHWAKQSRPDPGVKPRSHAARIRLESRYYAEVGTCWNDLELLLVYKYVIIYVYFKEVMQQEHLDGTHGTSLLLSFDIRFLDTWLQYTIVISIRKNRIVHSLSAQNQPTDKRA